MTRDKACMGQGQAGMTLQQREGFVYLFNAQQSISSLLNVSVHTHVPSNLGGGRSTIRPDG